MFSCCDHNSGRCKFRVSDREILILLPLFLDGFLETVDVSYGSEQVHVRQDGVCRRQTTAAVDSVGEGWNSVTVVVGEAARWLLVVLMWAVRGAMLDSMSSSWFSLRRLRGFELSTGKGVFLWCCIHPTFKIQQISETSADYMLPIRYFKQLDTADLRDFYRYLISLSISLV